MEDGGLVHFKWSLISSGVQTSEGGVFLYLSNYILSNGKMESREVFYWKSDYSKETNFIILN